jgi:O-acetyl-ADP-ribose deacetylase (regulator of RNase III)
MTAKIIYKDGDFLAGPEYFIAHGCNAQGKMRSGVAKAVRAKYPEAYEAYTRWFVSSGLKVGQVIVGVAPNRIIFNMITQKFYGRDKDVVYVDYEGIRNGINTINEYFRNFAATSVAFPRIGAGLANGDWDTIAGIIEETATFQPVVYNYEVDPDV